ncbi:retrovirus-related pol polyprotein from transposon TNT 1-94 [Tanacetum coccineum]|uniref:Retrovirus-related pol polyprotein from transposon TNT 1-94 n=1 Tax=Tanacetum coccineum TaxID=301880 RepID=A0ABQ5DP56_9ASTR
MSAFTNINLVFSASYIFHYEFAFGNDASADFTTEADLEFSAPNDFVPHQQGLDKGSKNNTLNHKFVGTNLSVLVDKTKSARDGSQTAHTISGTTVDTRSAFMDDEDYEDDPFITSKECNEEHAKRNKDTHAEPKITSVPPPSPTLLTEHLVSSMKLKFSKLLSSHDFRSSIPTELKELPNKITALSREVNELKKHIQEFEIKLPEVAELKKHMWELPKEFLALPGQISLIQNHVKTLEALLGLSNNVTDTLNMFASILNAHNKGVPLAGKSTASPAEGEKNTNPVIEDVRLANLIDLMGINVVDEYHKKKLLYNKYCEKMLKKKSPKITNCEVLTKKGPITLKIYREDESKEVISNLKIDLNKPLKEQDLMNELNELENKKRKKAGDFSKEPSPAWLTISSWTMPISLTEVEMKCFTSRRFTRREKDMLYVKKNKADVIGKEKQVSLADKSVEGSKHVDEALGIVIGIGSVMESDGTLNDATPLIDSVEKEVVLPSIDETVAKDKQTPSPTQETPSAGNAPVKSAYAIITGKPIKAKLNFHTTCGFFLGKRVAYPVVKAISEQFVNTPGGNGIDVIVSVESIKAISERFVNTTCGFFLGKRVAYPVVANYVRNTWGKFGLVRSMFSSSTGLFFFHFSSMDGLNAMLENGLWFIRNNRLILKKWNPDVNLLKEDVSTAPV